MKKHLISATAIAGLFFSTSSFANAPFVLDIQAYTNYSSRIIIKSKEDNLIIQDMNVNRGNCSVEVHGVYGGGSANSLKQALVKLADKSEIEKRAKKMGFPYNETDYQMAQIQGQPPKLGFGKQFKVGTNCKYQDILEINVDTNQGSWKFGG